MTIASSGAIKELVGLRLVLGVTGTQMTKEMIQQYKDTGAGGLILS